MNGGVPPHYGQALEGGQVTHSEQFPIVYQGNDVWVVPPNMTNEEVREALLTLT